MVSPSPTFADGQLSSLDACIRETAARIGPPPAKRYVVVALPEPIMFENYIAAVTASPVPLVVAVQLPPTAVTLQLYPGSVFSASPLTYTVVPPLTATSSSVPVHPSIVPVAGLPAALYKCNDVCPVA